LTEKAFNTGICCSCQIFCSVSGKAINGTDINVVFGPVLALFVQNVRMIPVVVGLVVAVFVFDRIVVNAVVNPVVEEFVVDGG